jgi:hypothetical protein
MEPTVPPTTVPPTIVPPADFFNEEDARAEMSMRAHGAQALVERLWLKLEEKDVPAEEMLAYIRFSIAAHMRM